MKIHGPFSHGNVTKFAIEGHYSENLPGTLEGPLGPSSTEKTENFPLDLGAACYFLVFRDLQPGKYKFTTGGCAPVEFEVK